MHRLTSPLVSAEELAEHSNNPEVVIADMRWYLDGRPGRSAYDNGHIPSATFIDLEKVCVDSGDPSQGRHPLPNPGQFVARLAELGIDPDASVVVYDDQYGSIAARLWWMLETLGIEAGILDGGINSWNSKLCRKPCKNQPVQAWSTPFGEWPADRVVKTETMTELVSLRSATVVDARARERYLGIVEPIDRIAGHIPGAISLPWTEMVSEGRFRSPSELNEIFCGTVPGSERIVFSCGSGVTACTLEFARRLAGFMPATIYEGSYSGWSSDEGRPICTRDCGLD
ncbi:MAG: sulfurtransferase [Ferrimicrobium sp.]